MELTYETIKLANEKGLMLFLGATQSGLQRWIEETQDIYIDTDTMTENNRIVGFNFFIKSYKFFPILLANFSDKYEGLEKSLQKALQLIETE